LPPETAKLGDKEIEYVLLHELAHYKRKDTLVKLTVAWFSDSALVQSGNVVLL